MMRSVYVFLLLLAVARPCSAQYVPSPDFLFGQPHGTVSFRTGRMMARADSDLFTFVQKQLTVDRKDFNAPAVGFDLDLAITPRVTAVAGFDFSRSRKDSEYRDLVDNDRLPIQQTTELSESNLSASIKFALTPRGREVSPHAWIPSTVTPYVGAGAGVMHYSFTQHGDFVDFTDTSVFDHTYNSGSWTPSAQVFGGVDVKAWKRIYFSGEARYLWSHADLGVDFSGFKPIDLAGLRVTGGIRYMF
jgi:opacity protein-like surface antigen